jgi:hypothetical protein
MEATKALLEAGKDLLDSDGSDNSSFVNALRALHTATGQQEPLPDQAKA